MLPNNVYAKTKVDKNMLCFQVWKQSSCFKMFQFQTRTQKGHFKISLYVSTYALFSYENV